MAAKQFNVRPLLETDLNEWFRLRTLLWEGADEDDHKVEMLDIIDHPEAQLVLVAENSSSNLVGFLEASIRPFVEDCETDNVGYIEGWFVEPSHRRMGIGGELVRSAERWAHANGCTEMASDAEFGNELGLAAHTGLGYAESSRLVHLRKVLR